MSNDDFTVRYHLEQIRFHADLINAVLFSPDTSINRKIEAFKAFDAASDELIRYYGRAYLEVVVQRQASVDFEQEFRDHYPEGEQHGKR